MKWKSRWPCFAAISLLCSGVGLTEAQGLPPSGSGPLEGGTCRRCLESPPPDTYQDYLRGRSNAPFSATLAYQSPAGRVPDGNEGIVTDRDLCIKVIAQGYSFETPVREFMSTPAHFVRPDATVQEMESLMRRHKIRRLPVVDEEQRLQGFISISDLARHCETYEDEHDLIEVLESVSTPRYT